MCWTNGVFIELLHTLPKEALDRLNGSLTAKPETAK
jgi:hypothetical protein